MTAEQYLQTLTVDCLATRETAIATLVEYDALKWGEDERAASRSVRGRLSHGLAANAVWSLCAMADLPSAKSMKKAVGSLLTAQDKAVIRQGG